MASSGGAYCAVGQRKECWNAAADPYQHSKRGLALSTLSAFWTAGFTNPPATWEHVAGPVGALLLSVARLGWTMTSPFVFGDDLGEEHKLTQDSPGLVQQIAKQAWRRKLEREVAFGMGLPFGHRVSVEHARGPAHSGTTSLSSLEQGTLRSWLCSAVWTRTRAAKYGYIVEDTRCPRCLLAQDTVEHRLWQCSTTADLRRTFTHDDLKYGYVAHPAEGQRGPLAKRGIIFWSADGVPMHEAFAGDLFTDGSCFKVKGCSELSRAG